MVEAVFMNSFCVALLVSFVSAFSFAGQASASQWMRLGGDTSIPYGHMVYCQQYAKNCAARPVSQPASMTRANWNAVQRINASVNAAITPRSDMEMHGQPDVWSYATSHGDCEDYALHKRRQLIAQGFHPSTVLLTMVRLRNGEAHIVVTLRTADGDFVLDNMRQEILAWNQTGYRFLKAQSPSHAGVWRTVSGGASAYSS
jgi:predicted transglutaminase-like cysteine proteinase